MHRPLILAGAALLLLGSTPSAGHGQTSSKIGYESVFHRARVAAALRDSILRLEHGLATQTTVSPPVLAFLKDPYRNPAVTLEQLDSAQILVNRTLRPHNPENTAGELLSGVGALTSLVGGGGAALPIIADGAANYFVDRAKDEVVFAFMLSLREDVKGDHLLAAAFPRSHQLITSIEGETYQSLTPLLRSAFLSDLDRLPARSDSLVDRLPLKGGTPEARAKIKNYLQGISIVYERGREIRDGMPASVALANLADIDATRMSDPRARQAIRLVGILSREYSATGGTPMIEEFTTRDRGWKRRYFVALAGHELLALEDTSRRLPAGDRQAVMDRLAAREIEVMTLLNQLHSIRGALGQLRNEITSAAEQTGPEPAEQFVSAAAALTIMRTATRLVLRPGEEPTPQVQEFERLLDDAIRLHQAITRKDYATLIHWLTQNPRFTFCANEKSDACRAQTRFVSLGASLATARTSHEVSEALQAASSPVGSFRVKRSSTSRWDRPITWATPRTASLVGYVGVGHYQPTGTNGDQGEWKFALPAGPEVSFGMPWGAVSVFIPLVDLGPVVMDAIQDDDEARGSLEERLFAPGAGVVLNLSRNFPLSVGASVTSTYYENAEGTGARKPRLAFFVGIDATLFHRRF